MSSVTERVEVGQDKVITHSVETQGKSAAMFGSLGTLVKLNNYISRRRIPTFYTGNVLVSSSNISCVVNIKAECASMSRASVFVCLMV